MPSRIETLPCEQLMDEAIRKYPAAARALGFDNDAVWRATLREFSSDAAKAGNFTPLGYMVQNNLLTNIGAYNAAMMAFLEPRLLPSGALPPISSNLELIIIAGSYRTGTSALQRILAVDSRAVSFAQWALLNPVSVESIQDAVKNPLMMNSSEPNNGYAALCKDCAQLTFNAHPMDPLLPEEDGWQFTLNGLGMIFDATSYWHGLLGQSSRRPKKLLQDAFFAKTLPGYVTAWLHPDSPLWKQWPASNQKRFLVLKGPQYASDLHALKRAFPRAKIVASHRNLTVQVPSAVAHFMTSLILYSKCTDKTDVAAIARRLTDHVEELALGLARGKDLVDLHVAHADIIKDPLAVIKKILALLPGDVGLPPPEEKRMAEYIGRNRYEKPSWRDFSAMRVDWGREIESREGFRLYQATYKSLTE